MSARKNVLKRRTPKPKALRFGSLTLAYAYESESEYGRRFVRISWDGWDTDCLRRLSAWLPGAIAWCEEGER